MPVGHIWTFDIEHCGVNMILGSNEIFQKFELSLSCSTFSQKVKISEIQEENDQKKREKVVNLSSEKLLFAISDI